jgi:hypothetical protein
MSCRSMTLLCIPLIASLCSCEFSDPLSAIDNGRGMELVDSLSGWNEDSRTICLTPERSRTSCSSRSAEVYITNVPRFGQAQAEWRNGDPSTVDVFVFGGTIVRCRPRSRQGEVRIILRQLPLSRMPSADSWNPDTTPGLSAGQPDRCDSSA